MRGEEGTLGFRESLPHRLRRPRGADDRPEIFGRAGTAGARERFESGTDLVEPGERETAMPDLEARRFGRLGEKARDLVLVEGRGQRQNRRPSGRRSSQGGNQAKDDAELERLEVGASPVTVGRGYIVARRSSESLRSIFFRA